MERGQFEGGDGEGATGRGRCEEEKKEQEEGHFTDGYDGMPGWTKAIGLSWKQIECQVRQRLLRSLIATSTCIAWVKLGSSFLTLFTRATPGTPASLY